MNLILIILLILMMVDAILLYKRSRKIIEKIIKKDIKERVHVAENLLIGMLASLMIYAITSNNIKIMVFASILILLFLILT